jgi:hypothetical protein
LLKHEPSAQSPWQNTMLGLLWVAFIFISPYLFFLTHISFLVPAASIP